MEERWEEACGQLCTGSRHLFFTHQRSPDPHGTVVVDA